MNVLFELISHLDKRVLAHLDKKLRQDLGEKETILYGIFSEYKKYSGTEKIDDSVIRQRVYGSKTSSTAYYRMKNRLVDIINVYLNEIEVGGNHQEVTNYINLYNVFFQKGIYRLAQYYLEKAEGLAQKAEQYEYLDIIYGLYIQLGKETLFQDPATFIEKRHANSTMLGKIRQIDDILSVVSYRLKVTQNLGEKLNVSKEVNNTIRRFSSDKELLNSVQFKIKMYKTISQIFVQQKEFDQLENYLRETYSQFETDKIFTRGTHDIKIEILIYIINTLLVRKKHAHAISFSEDLHQALLQYDKLLYKKYIYFYYQVNITAYSFIDADKAISIINSIIDDKNVITNPYYSLLCYSNLAYLYYGKNSFSQVIRNLKKVQVHEFYDKVDLGLKVRLGMLEMITRIDMGDYDQMEQRLVELKQNFKTLWKDFTGPETRMVYFVEEIGTNPDYMKDKKLREKAREFIASGEGETELFNYNRWITQKLKINY